MVIADAADAARAAASEGASVVIVGPDGGAAGTLAAEIESAGGRVAVLVGDLAAETVRAALGALLDELFSER